MIYDKCYCPKFLNHKVRKYNYTVLEAIETFLFCLFHISSKGKLVIPEERGSGYLPAAAVQNAG